jgi:DNA-binding response OmpR family regulator
MEKGIKILIVEDSPTQAEHLKRFLEEAGNLVSVASNGKEALSSMSKLMPMLVISDIIMPEMDGYQLCEHIKKDEKLKDIPVILVTSLSDPEDIIKGLECGADNFITKPYDEKYLLYNVRHILMNKELSTRESVKMGMEIFFKDKKYFITADRMQILNLLISTYETAVQKNFELIRARDELRALNEQLEEKVTERTASLITEIAERKRAEETIRRQQEHFKTVIENIFKFVPESLLVFTERLNLFKQNKAFDDLLLKYSAKLGYTEQELSEIIIEQIKKRIAEGEDKEIKIAKKRQ